jgi:hypothetical protein
MTQSRWDSWSETKGLARRALTVAERMPDTKTIALFLKKLTQMQILLAQVLRHLLGKPLK